jgi:GH25 family lysozyme M1 (1,4-beta-N-acetylmuramidase)
MSRTTATTAMTTPATAPAKARATARATFIALLLGMATACAPAADTAPPPPTRPAAARALLAGSVSPAEPVTPSGPTTPARPSTPAGPTVSAWPATPAGPAVTPSAAPVIAGIDVSRWQPHVDWRRVGAAGYRFAYISTVGSTGENPSFRQQWTGAGAAGLYRGAYYFGNPTTGSGKTQADQLLRHLGNVRDARTLPPMLDVETHAHLAACDGVRPTVWVSYIRSFVTEVKVRLGVSPVIYATKSFWQACVGNPGTFAPGIPLFVAQWNVAAPSTFGGWRRATFWQHSSTGHVPGITATTDLDIFYGTPAELQALAVPAR